MKNYLFVILLAPFFLIPSAAWAQSSAIATQKGLYDLELIPGSSQDGRMVIYNLDQSQPLAVHGQLSLWDVKGDSDEIQYVTAQPNFNAAKWFEMQRGKTFASLTQTDFIIDPDGRREIPFRVTAPADAVPGTYLVVARFRQAAPSQSFVTFVPEIDVLFFIKVASFSLENGVETGYNADIELAFAKDEEVSAKTGALVAHAGVLDGAIKTVVAKIKNTGLYYFRADGKVVLKNWLGRVVKEVPLPKRYLLPNRVRTIEIPVEENTSSQGFFSSVGTFLAQNSYFGPYTATVVLNFPQATSQTDVGVAPATALERSFTVWIVPWRFWLPVVLIVALLIWLATRGRKRFVAAWRILFRKSG